MSCPMRQPRHLAPCVMHNIKFMKIIILLFIISSFSNYVIGQPTELFSITSNYSHYQLDFYRQDEKTPIDAVLLPDSSLLIICSAGYGNSSVLKLDLNGKVVWEKFCKDLSLKGITLDNNSNIIIAGSNSKNKGWIGKYSVKADTLWERTFDVLFYNDITTITIADNDDILISGTARQIELPFYLNRSNDKCFFEHNLMLNHLYPNRLFIAKLDSRGNKKWKKIFKPSSRFNHFFLAPNNFKATKNSIHMSSYHGYMDYGSSLYNFNKKGKTLSVDLFHPKINRRGLVKYNPQEINIKSLHKTDSSLFILSHINNYINYNDTIRIIEMRNNVKYRVINYCLKFNDTSCTNGNSDCSPVSSFNIEDFHINNDGSFVIVGQKKRNPWILKINSDGNFIWEWEQESEFLDTFTHIIVNDANEAFILGEKRHNNLNNAGSYPVDLIVKKMNIGK